MARVADTIHWLLWEISPWYYILSGLLLMAIGSLILNNNRST